MRDGENRVRIAVMLGVQRCREAVEHVAKNPVDQVFDKRPREQPERKHREIERHHDDRTSGLQRVQIAPNGRDKPHRLDDHDWHFRVISNWAPSGFPFRIHRWL